ncbi:hypothetical protein BC834DRAFT_406720 [Gloeopeniophorella convolvens]|nr:hypothetical protein BC834DRAFT_406720 [Gloeopeniophorella convolvens]
MNALLKQRYDTDGFVVIPGLVSPQEHTDLLAATERTTARTRTGTWPHARVVGKQFPPYGAGSDVWGVQHAMHPALGEPAFARWYAGAAVRDAARGLLGCGDGELQMELFNILVNPAYSEFALCWHRDDVKGAASEEEERAALAVRHYGVQWNTALHEDASLYVVPSSHRVPRTTEQRALSCDTTPPADPLIMPGAIQVTLQPGETVFYNNNILHCATYSPSKPRATLHACIGDTRGGSTRARNILQHGLEWIKEDTFRETLSPEGRGMLEKLVQMQESLGTKEVEYSLEG